jgi:hypothetical protein
MKFITENIEIVIGAIGSIVTYFAGKKMHKIEEKKANSDALQGIQAVYEKFVEQTDKKFMEMQKEIEDLKGELMKYFEQCSTCSNNKIGKSNK